MSLFSIFPYQCTVRSTELNSQNNLMLLLFYFCEKYKSRDKENKRETDFSEQRTRKVQFINLLMVMGRNNIFSLCFSPRPIDRKSTTLKDLWL